jgi:AraC-like DNA-binding protein
MEQVSAVVKNYFSVSLAFAFGAKVQSPLSIPDSYNTALMALSCGKKDYAAVPIENRAKQAETENGRPPFRRRPEPGLKRGSYKENIVSDIKGYIKNNIGKRLSLKQVADVFGFSPKYISLLFADHSEANFVEYINAEKIARAREMLLQNDALVYEISERLGFESSFYFSRVFKKHTGLSPRDFIKQQTEDRNRKKPNPFP